jgi:HEAT repeat protein
MLLLVLSVAERDDVRLDFVPIYALGLTDPDAEVRRSAAAAIVADDAASLLGSLLSVLRTDPSADVRQAAASALAGYALRGEVGELPEAEAERIRSDLLATARNLSEAAAVRSASLGAVGYFSDAQVQDELRSAHGDPALRLGALRGMGRSADARWIDMVRESLDSDDSFEREEAARAAGEIEDESLVPGLVDAIDDSIVDVSLAAVRSLGQIASDEAREALAYAATGESTVLREAAERALASLDTEEGPFEE